MNVITGYRLEELMAASPSRLVVMLYDEAIAALRVAIESCKAGDVERRCNAVTAATEIVGYLYMHLDLERGGEVARNLGAIYGHVIGRLPMVNLYNGPGVAEEAIELLEPLRRSWDQLDLQLQAEAAEAAPLDPAVAPGAVAHDPVATGAGD